MSDDNVDGTPAGERPSRKRTVAVAAGVGVAGLLAGGLAAGALSSASADTGGTSGYGARGYGGPDQQGDPSKPMRSDEKLLTGTTRTKVLAAVSAKYPDATVERVETDSDGVYEAHIVQDGQPMIVQVGKDFTITGTQSGFGGGRGHGPGGGPVGDGEDGPPRDSSYRQS
jgi:hypothetical protein